MNQLSIFQRDPQTESRELAHAIITGLALTEATGHVDVVLQFVQLGIAQAERITGEIIAKDSRCYLVRTTSGKLCWVDIDEVADA